MDKGGRAIFRDEGRAILRSNHYNPYNLRLTPFRRRRRVEIEMSRHIRFNDDNELVSVDHNQLVDQNQEAVPLQQIPPQERPLQHQRRRAQRARNRQNAQEEQNRQNAGEQNRQNRQNAGEQNRGKQNRRSGGSVWSKKEEKLLFKAIAHFKKYNNKCSRLNWDTVYGYYALCGGAATSLTQLQIHWGWITALKKAGHFNDCSFFNDPDCSKDFDLVFQDGFSSSSSNAATNAAGRGDTSRSSYETFQPNIAAQNRRVRNVFSANNQAIDELLEFHMIDEQEAGFAKQKFANVENVSGMEHFSFLKNNVVRADFIRCAIRADSQSSP